MVNHPDGLTDGSVRVCCGVIDVITERMKRADYEKEDRQIMAHK
jgi:hypothetical protein